MEQLGALAAMGAALMWSINGVVAEKKGKGFDGGSLNFGRLLLGFLLITTLNLALGGAALPPFLGLSPLMLAISGLFGFSLGDTFLYGAFQTIGARVTLLIFSFSPVLTAILSFFLFNETLNTVNLLGIFLVIAGILAVVSSRGAQAGPSLNLKGIVYAGLAALGQSLGTVFSKLGLQQGISPLVATQIRLIGGILGMAVVLSLGKKWSELGRAACSVSARLVIVTSAVLGTLLGVVLSMVSLQLTKAAIAAVLMSTMPILILPLSVLFLKEKLSTRDIAGAVLSVAGMAVLAIF